MTDLNKKKSSILGSNTLNFIANMVSKGINSDMTIDQTKIIVDPEETKIKITDLENDLITPNQISLEAHFSTELNLGADLPGKKLEYVFNID